MCWINFFFKTTVIEQVESKWTKKAMSPRNFHITAKKYWILLFFLWCRKNKWWKTRKDQQRGKAKKTLVARSPYLSTHMFNIHIVSKHLGKFFTRISSCFRLITPAFLLNLSVLYLKILLKHKSQSNQQFHDLKEVKDLCGICYGMM